LTEAEIRWAAQWRPGSVEVAAVVKGKVMDDKEIRVLTNLYKYDEAAGRWWLVNREGLERITTAHSESLDRLYRQDWLLEDVILQRDRAESALHRLLKLLADQRNAEADLRHESEMAERALHRPRCG